MQSPVRVLFTAALSLSALPPDHEFSVQDRQRVAAMSALRAALSQMQALGASTAR